jgi:hypothetical protein
LDEREKTIHILSRRYTRALALILPIKFALLCGGCCSVSPEYFDGFFAFVS